MKRLLLTALAVFLTAASATDQQLLVFDFPDGARGGYGNIQGLGQWSHGWSQSTFVQKIKSCGAIDPKFKALVTHRVYVFTKSGPNDRRVAECVKRVLPKHFSVGLWIEKPGHVVPALDQRPFMAMWNRKAPRRVNRN